MRSNGVYIQLVWDYPFSSEVLFSTSLSVDFQPKEVPFTIPLTIDGQGLGPGVGGIWRKGALPSLEYEVGMFEIKVETETKLEVNVWVWWVCTSTRTKTWFTIPKVLLTLYTGGSPSFDKSQILLEEGKRWTVFFGWSYKGKTYHRSKGILWVQVMIWELYISNCGNRSSLERKVRWLFVEERITKMETKKER